MAFGLWALRWSGPIDLRYDGAVYYLLGTSLAAGEGYRIKSEPGAPHDIQYPPLLPLIVAAHQKALGSADPAVVGPWLRRTYAVMFLAYGLAVLALARAHVRPWLALLATVLCIAHQNTYLLSDLLFTELPFSLVCVSFILLLQTRKLASHPNAKEVLTFVLSTAGFMLRTAGIALLVTWVADALVRRAWRLALLRAVLAALPVIGWQAYVWRVQASDEFKQPAYAYQRAPYQYYNVTYGANLALIDPFRPELGYLTPTALARRVATNIATLPISLGEAVSASMGFWRAVAHGDQERGDISLFDRIARTPLYLLAALAVTGGIVLSKRRRWPLVIFAVVSIGLVCTTPWPDQIGRYFSPIAPFLAIAAVVGVATLANFLRRQPAGPLIHVGRIAVWAFCFLVLAIQGGTAMMVFRQRHYEPATFVPGRGLDAPRWFYYDRSWAEWENAVRWIRTQAAPDDVVVTSSPHLCYIWTGLHAVMPPMEIDPAKARQLMDTVPGTWLIVDELKFLDIAPRYALPAVTGDPLAWRLVRRFGGGTQVFQRVPVTSRSRVADVASPGIPP